MRPIRFPSRVVPAARRPVSVEPLEHRTLMSVYTVTNLLDHGAGSLRQAVANANAHAGADTVKFAGGVHGTVVLTTGALNVTGDLTVNGPGSGQLKVSGNHASRVVRVPGAGTTVTLRGLTISDGDPGLSAGGGIVNYGRLTLSRVVVSNNVAAGFATGASAGVGGGGLMNYGTATVTDCGFVGNKVFSHDNKFLSGGGAIYNAGTLTVSRSLLADNVGKLSPSVHPGGPNPAAYGANGGAIYDAGTMRLTNTTVSGNHADVLGGGLYVGRAGKATLVNCTVTRNVGAFTGGVCVFFAQDVASTAKLTLGNTIVAGNGDTEFDSGRADLQNNADTQSLGHNLIGVDSGSVAWKASDLTGTEASPLDPKLAAPAFNGGPTRTHALLAASPARNGGSNAVASAYGLTTDQRGFPRRVGPAVDIGAFER